MKQLLNDKPIILHNFLMPALKFRHHANYLSLSKILLAWMNESSFANSKLNKIKFYSIDSLNIDKFKTVFINFLKILFWRAREGCQFTKQIPRRIYILLKEK